MTHLVHDTMLRFAPPTTSAADVKAYYLEGSQPYRADYYLENEGIGVWGGLGAQRLGLSGRITRDPFEALADNIHPVTGQRLTQRNKVNRRVGYDLSFHVPKSVSLAWAFGRDDRIIKLIERAAQETLELMERETEARVRIAQDNPGEVPGVTERITGELTYAQFTHLTARPPRNSDVPDPLLHVHAFIFNHTFDPEEMKHKAVDIARIQRDAPYYQAIFHSVVAKGLIELGYQLDRKGGRHVAGYEIAGITPELIQKYSQRDQEIRREIRELGITDPAKKARVAERTRRKKTPGRYSLDQLRVLWKERLSIQELATLAFIRRSPKTPDIEPAKALDHAVEHSFERHSTVRARELVRQSLKMGIGSVTRDQIEQAFGQRKWFSGTDRWGRTVVTTPEMLSLEEQLVNFAKHGQGRWSSLGPTQHKFEPIDGQTLSKDQEEAAREVLASKNRVTFLAGKAGVGKTTTMRHIEAAMNRAGRTLVPLAPSAKASRGVLRKEGFHKADTVASFFERDDLKRLAHGQVIWVDEASLLGTNDYHRLFWWAEKLKARVLLTGDPMQHKSVQAGNVLDSLVKHHGVQPIELSAIRRQRGKYLNVVEHFSEGKTARGFDLLEDMGAVVELGTDDRYRQMAMEYAQAIAKRRTALAVAPTKAEGRIATAHIRSELKDRGLIAETDREFTHLRDLQLTTAQKRQAGSYELGDVIQFHRDSEGYGRGARLTVVGLEGDRVLAATPGSGNGSGSFGAFGASGGGGKVRVFEPKHADHVGVFRPEALQLARGDLVMVSQNTRTRDGRTKLANGEMAKVHGFKPNGDIQLQTLTRDQPRKRDGIFRGRGKGKPKVFTLDGDNGFLNHAYCVTSHKGQGDTVDYVFVAQGGTSFPASSLEQIYTTLSRGRLGCKLFTDDLEGLRRAVQRSESVKTALELAALAEDSGRAQNQRTRDAFTRMHEKTAVRVNTRPLAQQRQRPKHWPIDIIRKYKGRGGPSHER
ncbi:MAG: MobF family relaxase [Planctomycetota bacterium]